MDAIQEESVGFLFNLEVQVDAEAATDESAAAGAAAPDAPELDAEAVLSALAAGEPPAGTPGHPEQHPQIKAKGLGRGDGAAPLTYSAPTLGSEDPEVHTEGSPRPAAGNRSAAARQRKANPNRGSRGNKRKR
jgi:preprotein translocase subunit SecA